MLKYRKWRYFFNARNSDLSHESIRSLLKDYRKSQNISQKELAERTQICQSRISFLENHPENISIGQLMRWLSVLGLEIKIAVKKDEPMTTEW